MFCHVCGAALPPGAQFCPSCSKPVSGWEPGATNSVAPPEAPARPDLPEASPISGPQARPWVRYWARMGDLILFALPMGVVLTVIWPSLLVDTESGGGLLLGLMVLLSWALVEPLCLSVFGTTPWRSLLRIRLQHPDGRPISYGEALRRSLKVWVKGLGLGLPFVSLITLFVAYRRLKREGRTSWDADGGFTVTHQTIGAGRTVAAVLFFLIFLMLMGSGG